ncbi:hypothetical protein K3X13_04350 [Aliiroseovarius crassostreae]|uniref:hypothetical protein n=1 Tax=Aliiroseovarius crassostreae TaxID=154981 RepID=UPI0022044C6B|nr:hypothetical protein [Aliiroseovarius crassostreae]UWP93080.1 hypothetical protein K3X13_04350 [Aliiroseovarius crassostreae]
MIHFSLPKFIQFCHYDPTELLTELDKKLNPRGTGHQFHWSLRSAITAFIEGKDKHEIEEILNRPTKDVEKHYNQAAFEVFLKRFGKSKTLEIVDHVEVYPVVPYNIEITVEPWFSTFENGITHLHVVWAYSKPTLEQRNANIGNLVFEKAFATTRLGNAQFCIMDLAMGRRFSNKTVSGKTEMAFESVCSNIAREAQRV